MPKWYEIPHGQRTDEQNRRAQQSYYLALLSTKEGQEVVCDMKRRVSELIEGCGSDPNCAVAQLWLAGFVEDTITLCGVVSIMALVEAQSRIARSYIHKEVKPDIPEDYAE